MATTMSIEELIGQQYDLLGHGLCPGTFTEVRLLPSGKQYFVQSKEDFVDVAKIYKNQDAYVSINPRTCKSGLAKDVAFLSCCAIDVDPIRPKGEGSTEEAHKAAIELGTKIRDDFGSGTVVSSGSGCHVYLPIIPIKVTNHQALTASTKAWMNLMQKRYDTKELRLDSIHDLPRVLRIWGSHNSKSNRICGPVSHNPNEARQDYQFSQVEEKAALRETMEEGPNERFDNLVKTNTRLADIVNGVTSYPSRSEADYAFTMTLAKAHFSPSEIKELMIYCPQGTVMNPKKDDKESDIDRDINKIIKENISSVPTKASSLIHNSAAYFDNLSNRKMGILTGFNALDEMISGLKRQKLYIFAARPNDGKTTLFVQMLTNIAEQGKTCLLYPTEVGPDPIFDKIIARKSGVWLKKFQNGTFTEAELAKINGVRKEVEKLPIIVIEDFGTTIETIEQGIKTYSPQVLAIDFFQALKWKDPDSVGEKSNAVRRLKELAGDYNLPVLIASQLNRGDGTPNLKNLKGTGTLEELGDVIAYLHPGSKITHPFPVDLVIMKSKYSQTGTIKLIMHSAEGRYTEDEVKF